MTTTTDKADEFRCLLEENAELRARLDEAEQTLGAIGGGEIDAVVVGDQIYMLESADSASNRFRGEVIAQINDAVIAVDNEERVTYLNPAAERQYGVVAHDVLGRKLSAVHTHRFLDPDEEVRAYQALQQKGCWNGENIHRRGDGSEIFVESAVSVLRDLSGNSIGMLAVIRDISDRKLAERALKEAHDLLEQRVLERTSELADANESLQREIHTREAAERQKVALLQRVVTSQEDERRRVARDVHDHLGQRVTALRLQIAALKDPSSDTACFKERIRTLEETTEKLDQEVSFLAWELRPATVGHLGFAEAATEFLNEWSSHKNIRADLILRGFDDYLLSDELATHLYRIMQEALNNVAKHARATSVSMLLERKKGQISMIVEDDGVGFHSHENGQKKHHGLGLSGMKERAALLGGSLEIESVPENGTTIYVRVPETAHGAAHL